jgi:hypothetical protein
MSDERPDEQPADEKPGDGLPTHIQRADGLTHKQEAAIIALLERADGLEGGRGVRPQRSDDLPLAGRVGFSKAYRKARRESFAQAIAATQRYAPVAVQTLAKIMADPTLSASARVSAATGLLKFSRESIELDDLATRVDDLEKSMKQEAEQKPPTAAWGDNACA